MYSAISGQAGRELVATGKEAEFAIRRRRALKRVDKELSRGNFKTALSLVKQLQRNPAGGLRGFGAVKQVPKRVTSLNELELDSKELLPLQSLLASVMESIERCNFFDSFDEAASDRVESLMEDESYGSLNEKDHSMCMQHEAGHFLVGYLLGVLPKGYNVPSIEALRQEESAVGSVQFIGFEFLNEIAHARRLRTYTAQGGGRVQHLSFFSAITKCRLKDTISSKTLSNFSCVILGGLVAEHIVFGHSEGHYADIDKLEYLFRWLGYKRSEVDSRVQWAALNTVLISFQHVEVRSQLAEAMSLGRSVGFCIDTIESALYRREM